MKKAPYPFGAPFSLFSALVRVLARFFLAQGPLHGFFFIFASCRQLSCAFFCFFSLVVLRGTLQDSKIPSKTCNCHQKSRFRYFEKIKLLSPLGYHFGWHLGHMGPTLGSAWAPWAPFGGPWAPKGAQKSAKSV